MRMRGLGILLRSAHGALNTATSVFDGLTLRIHPY